MEPTVLRPEAEVRRHVIGQPQGTGSQAQVVWLADGRKDGGTARRVVRCARPRGAEAAMQVKPWKNQPLGMYDLPTANYQTDIHDGRPQFYGVKKNL